MEGDQTKVLLVTANVGSIFEDPEHMLKIWLKEFLSAVQEMEPGMLAIHCQEVGGKNYEASMQHVNHFVKSMLGSDVLQKYDRARVFLDEDYTAADKFTALGNLYFIHESVEDVMIFDFVECKFIPVEGREVLSGNIENIQIKEKAKYPQNFFPDFKWSRKGFLRTRWSVNNCVFDLINIHLFHDASNIIAMQKSPSIYVENRYRALAHTLQRFETDQFEKVPFFLFGDFNFRLDLKLLLKELTVQTKEQEVRGKKDQISKVSYRDANNKVVLTVESKYFDHHEKHNEVFSNKNQLLNKYDTEPQQYKDKVFEYDINFPPSYPFSEDVNDGLSYMKTRCPSWCDRILLSHSTKDIINSDEQHKPRYQIIGKDFCMGDHKPVFLSLLMKKGKGKPPLVESQSSYERRKMFSQKISINGETLDWREEHVNIHDFATFEKVEELIPEFRLSIKSRKGQLTRQTSLNIQEEGESQITERSDAPMKRPISFTSIARQVYLMENVLLRWPRRPKHRHHSSSSEDCIDDGSESEAEKDSKVKVEGGESKSANPIKFADSEEDSADTEISDVESDHADDTDTVLANAVQKLGANMSHNNQNILLDKQSCDQSGRTGVKQGGIEGISGESLGKLEGKDKGTSRTEHVVGNDLNNGIDVDDVKVTEKTEKSKLLHEKENVRHEHVEPEKVKEVTGSNPGKEKADRRFRCPFCVIL